MLSDDDRRALAEIERQLHDDRALRRSFRHAGARPVSWTRRIWWAVLLTSLVLMLGLAALDVASATLECAGLAAVAWTALRLTRRPRTTGSTGHGHWTAGADRR